MKNKKLLSGNIYGFHPSLGTFHNIEGRLDRLWSAAILDFDFSEKKTITFSFSWSGYKYLIKLKRINETNFQGRAILDGEEDAKVYYTVYTNEKGFALIGTWDEDIAYDSLIQVFK